MLLNLEVEYSLVIIAYLANRPGFTPLRSLADQTGLPYRFVVKIAHRLKQAGLLTAKEGRGGGYQLAGGWERLSLYQLMRLFSPKGVWVKCEDDKYHCPADPACAHKGFFTRYMVPLMEAKSIKEIISYSVS